MVAARDFTKGIVITFEGAPYTILDYHIHKTAQRKPVLQTKLRHLHTGRIMDRTFNESDQFEQPQLQTRPHQYLYHEPAGHVFMDNSTFDQVTLPDDFVAEAKYLLREQTEYPIRFLDDKPIGLVLPPNFSDQITETPEPSKEGRGTNVMKDAKLACGLSVKVPMFVRTGDYIRIDTQTHAYMGKENPPK